MSGFKTIDDFDVRGQRVLVRGDLNVPMEDGKVTDTTRLDRMARTITDLSDAGAKVIVLSHFGRPKGQVVPAMSLAPVAEALGDVLRRGPLAFAADCIGPAAEACVDGLADGAVAVLENLRFHGGEEANDPDFAASLASLGDLYVNDAFSASHRAHASIQAIARLLPAAAGRLMQRELEALQQALGAPERPVAAVVGGAKVSTKIAVLEHLVSRVDALIIGGAMANTFLLARGHDVGRSLIEADMVDTARAVSNAAEEAGCRILLPRDAVVARALQPGVETTQVAIDAIPDDAMMLDVGDATVEDFANAIEASRTLVWNGPLGAFEVEPFDEGTRAVSIVAASRTEEGALLSVAGGGDTVAALVRCGTIDHFTYVSTAGGAFLEWLEGKTLPGVAALEAAAS